MSDTELAQEMVREFLHLGRSLDVELYDEEIKRAKVLIARVRLDEAKWWHDALKEDEAQISIYLVQAFSERLTVLEQAAGGSAAAGSQK